MLLKQEIKLVTKQEASQRHQLHQRLDSNQAHQDIKLSGI